MSTSWNAECMDHPDAPDLLDEDVNGGSDSGARWLSDLLSDRAAVLAVLEAAAPTQRRDVGGIDVEVQWHGRYLWDAREGSWLRAHGNCRIELVNEYGHRVTPDLEPRPPHHCKTCTCEPQS